MKILNLYAGIGGNRKLWGNEHEITAVEYDKAIAEAYQDRFPNDTVIVGDAKQYLLDHYKEFDFIWASPPCQTHSRARRGRVDVLYPNGNSYGAVYADLSMYEIIILLENFYDGKYCVENVIPYYGVLMRFEKAIDRHLFWANFKITDVHIDKPYKIGDVSVEDFNKLNIKETGVKNKIQVFRNQVNSETAKHILDCALGRVKHRQGGLF